MIGLSFIFQSMDGVFAIAHLVAPLTEAGILKDGNTTLAPEMSSEHHLMICAAGKEEYPSDPTDNQRGEIEIKGRSLERSEMEWKADVLDFELPGENE